MLLAEHDALRLLIGEPEPVDGHERVVEHDPGEHEAAEDHEESIGHGRRHAGDRDPASRDAMTRTSPSSAAGKSTRTGVDPVAASEHTKTVAPIAESTVRRSSRRAHSRQPAARDDLAAAAS